MYTDKKTKQLQIKVSPDFHRAVMSHANKKGISVSVLVREALRRRLPEPQPKEKKETTKADLLS